MTSQYIAKGLGEAGHICDVVVNGHDALFAATRDAYDVIIADRMVPGLDGLSMIKAARAAGVRTPAIFLTSIGGIDDRVEGLEAGGDDYLVKPFDLGELTARILAVSRRAGGNVAPVLAFGDFRINRADRQIVAGQDEVSLSGREWAVLDVLIARPGAIVSKGQIEEALYAFGSEIESNTVEVYVSRLRKKLGRQAILTLRGVGYKMGETCGGSAA